MSERRKHLSKAALVKVAELFKVLSEPMRLMLLYALTEGEKSVSQLVQETGATQANVSKHLAILLDAGVVGRRKQGTSSYYRITDESVFELCDVACGSIYDRMLSELGRFSAAPPEPPRDHS